MRTASGWVIVALFCFSCGESSRPNVTFYRGNSLMPSISFTTPKSENVYVEYWKKGIPSSAQTSKISNGSTHNIVLLNINEQASYQYVIHEANEKWKSDEYEFVAGPVPDEAFKVNLEKIDTSIFTGFILVRRLSQSGADAILNNKGEIVWYHVYDTVVRRAFSWTKKGTILSVYDSARITEFDLLGNKVLDLNLETLNVPNKLHHEILYNSSNQIVALTLDSAQVDLTRFGGKKNQNLRADGIILLDTAGKKVWEWNLLQKALPSINQLGVAHLDQSWGHANSFAIAQDGHYVVSLKEFNQVWKVNSQDGTIIWKLGKNGDFKMNEDDYFIGQHSVCYTPDGNLMMYDNGSQKQRPNSRVLSFQLDEQKMVAIPKVKANLPIELSGYRMGSAEMIEKGKYLVCAVRRGGAVAIVDDGGKTMWKVVLNNPSYRAYYLKDPFSNKNSPTSLNSK